MKWKLSLLTLLFMLASFNLHAQKQDKEYIYVLKLSPEFYNPDNWTERENNIVQDHFNRLKKMLEEGSLVLAGRTLNTDDDGFGIVIFNAASDEEAERIAESDPAVKAGIMSAQVFPYRTALIKNSKKDK